MVIKAHINEYKNKLLNSPISRRNVVKSGAAGGLFAAVGGLSLPFNAKAIDNTQNSTSAEEKPFGAHVPLTVVAVAYYVSMFVTMKYIGLNLIPREKMNMAIIK